MVTREDIENFLDRLTAEGTTYSEIEPGLWIVKPNGALDLDVVVHYSPPVVVLRVKVMNVPSDGDTCGKLNRRLLELNATDLVHGSYGRRRRRAPSGSYRPGGCPQPVGRDGDRRPGDGRPDRRGGGRAGVPVGRRGRLPGGDGRGGRDGDGVWAWV